MKNITELEAAISKCTRLYELKDLLDDVDIRLYNNDIILADEDWPNFSKLVNEKVKMLRVVNHVKTLNCLACGQDVAVSDVVDNDGFCPRCDNEITMDEEQ